MDTSTASNTDNPGIADPQVHIKEPGVKDPQPNNTNPNSSTINEDVFAPEFSEELNIPQEPESSTPQEPRPLPMLSRPYYDKDIEMTKKFRALDRGQPYDSRTFWHKPSSNHRFGKYPGCDDLAAQAAVTSDLLKKGK
ncbi:hypothetical protein RUND412_001559 [Rhizina undulata]